MLTVDARITEFCKVIPELCTVILRKGKTAALAAKF